MEQLEGLEKEELLELIKAGMSQIPAFAGFVERELGVALSELGQDTYAQQVFKTKIDRHIEDIKPLLKSNYDGRLRALTILTDDLYALCHEASDLVERKRPLEAASIYAALIEKLYQEFELQEECEFEGVLSEAVDDLTALLRAYPALKARDTLLELLFELLLDELFGGGYGVEELFSGALAKCMSDDEREAFVGRIESARDALGNPLSAASHTDVRRCIETLSPKA